MIDLAPINSWVLYNSSITRKQIIQKVCEELTGNIQNEKVAPASIKADESAPKRRAICSTGRWNKKCTLDNKSLCGKCALNKCPKC